MPADPRRLLALLAALALSAPASAQPARAEPAPEEIRAIEADLAAAESMRRFGSPAAPAKPAGAVRVATYNVENLFDDVDDPALSGEQDDAGETKELHERLAVAKAIRALDADILCLEEIESEAALLWFRDQFLADMGYDHAVSIDAGDDRGIENAVLSRHPIADAKVWPDRPLGGVHPEKYGNGVNWHAGQPIAFRRSPLKADVSLPDGRTLTVFVVHHKSGGPSAYWREAEARGVLELVGETTAADPGRPVLVLGDFNAQPSDKSVKTYLDAGLHDIFAKHPKSDAIVTHESGRRIDLILANEAAKAQMLVDKAFVLGTPARPAGIDWRDLDTFPGLASDHYPVAVDVVPRETPETEAADR